MNAEVALLSLEDELFRIRRLIDKEENPVKKTKDDQCLSQDVQSVDRKENIESGSSMYPSSVRGFRAKNSNKRCRRCGRQTLRSEVRVSIPRNGRTRYFHKN